jgi:hypothetical protein
MNKLLRATNRFREIDGSEQAFLLVSTENKHAVRQNQS